MYKMIYKGFDIFFVNIYLYFFGKLFGIFLNEVIGYLWENGIIVIDLCVCMLLLVIRI